MTKGVPGSSDLQNTQNFAKAPSARMHGHGISSLRVQGKPRDGYHAWALTVPAAVCRLLPASMQGALFTCELTDEGILFRPLIDDTQEAARPEWVKRLNGG